jgi:hypothetical protein
MWQILEGKVIPDNPVTSFLKTTIDIYLFTSSRSIPQQLLLRQIVDDSPSASAFLCAKRKLRSQVRWF